MVRWIEEDPAWDGGLPAVLVAPAVAAEARRRRLEALAARALGCPPAEVAVEVLAGRRPRIGTPAGSGLFLSSSSRAGVMALALARAPVGVDVELAEPGGEIPWLVLHPDEAAALRRLDGRERDRAFARLWSVKEAYLKALRLGFSREPESFAVRLGPGPIAIEDPAAPAPVARVESRLIDRGDREVAAAVVLLGPARP